LLEFHIKPIPFSIFFFGGAILIANVSENGGKK
jgi:hypothetical protein